METINPAELAEQRKRRREALEEDAKLNDNLLSILKKQTDEYEFSEKVLSKISFHKQIINSIQKDLYQAQTKTDLLENNIIKRVMLEKQNRQTINNLQKNITLETVKNRRFTDSELNTLLKFKDIYGHFNEWKKGNYKISKEELDIITKVKKIQHFGAGLIKYQKEESAKRTKELMLQAIVQKKQNELLHNELMMYIEEVKLQKEQQNVAKAELRGWIDRIPLITKTKNLLSSGDTIFKAIGVKSNIFSKLMSGPMLSAATSLVAVLSKAVTTFLDLDKSAFEFRKQFGFSRETSKDLETRVKNITISTARLGIGFGDVFEAITKVSAEVGSANYVTDKTVKSVSILNKQYGIAAETSAVFLKSISSISETTVDAQDNMLGFAHALSNASKIPLSDIMKDVSESVKSSYSYISREPLKLIQAAVEAKRLGTTLSALAASSKSLLNFSESISNEMEFSVLSGRNINLQRARELAYNKDLVGLNKEILKLAKEVNFNQLDPYSQEAFAKAVGKSTDEIGKMIQSEKERNVLIAHANKLAQAGDSTLLNQIKHEDSLLKMKKQEGEITGEQAKKNWENRQNQERIAAIQASINEKLMKLGMVFLPIIDKFLEKSLDLINTLSGHIGATAMYIAGISKGIQKVGVWIAKAVSHSGVLLKTFGKIVLPIAKTARLFARWLGPIGVVITVLEAGYNILKRWEESPKGFWNGVKAVAMGLYDTLIQPFVDVWNWCDKHILGHSPSELGLLMVEGIKSVGSMIFDNITYPYRKAWDWITSLFSKNKIQPTIEKPILQDKISSMEIPVNNRVITNKDVGTYDSLNTNNNNVGVKLVNPETKTVNKEPETSANDLNESLKSLLIEIKGLRSDLSNGKIAVNMDGQLVSTVMNRTLKFRGEYGAIN